MRNAWCWNVRNPPLLHERYLMGFILYIHLPDEGDVMTGLDTDHGHQLHADPWDLRVRLPPARSFKPKCEAVNERVKNFIWKERVC